MDDWSNDVEPAIDDAGRGDTACVAKDARSSPGAAVLDELRRSPRFTWAPTERMWIGDAGEAVQALSRHRFEESTHDIVRCGADGDVLGGLWQGLNPRTGDVASVVWIRYGAVALLVVDVNGMRLDASRAA